VRCGSLPEGSADTPTGFIVSKAIEELGTNGI
jgi:hypothetical protein